ncbi:MAG: Crp/Fnr family transcriptional regulator [Cyclobacteriaceae bacterium]
MDDLNDILKKYSNTKTKQFKKGSILQHKGQAATHAFYVKKGLLRSYIIDSKGKQHIFMFAPEGWIIADIESQEFDLPAEMFIDCLEDSELIIFNRKNLISTDPELLIKNLKLLFRRTGVLQKRILMQMSAPAIDRYTYFIKTYPELAHRIPQHMIASYLGITPQALSTIRSDYAK